MPFCWFCHDEDHICLCFCNISAMGIEITKTYGDMIGLRQLLYMCKAEKTHLNGGFEIRGLCV